MPKQQMYVVLHYAQGEQVSTSEGMIQVPVPNIFGPFGEKHTAATWARSQYFIAFEVVELEAP